MTKRQLEKRIAIAQERIKSDIRMSAERGGKFAGALSVEGYHGGYRDALSSIINLINDVEPNDDRGYWRK